MVYVNVSANAILLATYNTDPYAGAYKQGTISIDLTSYNAVLLEIHGLYSGNGKIIYLNKGQRIVVGDYSGTSGGGRGYTFLANGSGITEDINGNSYGAWGNQYVHRIWGIRNTLL